MNCIENLKINMLSNNTAELINDSDVFMEIFPSPPLAGFPPSIDLQPNTSISVVLPEGEKVCFRANCEEDTCTGLFDCSATNLVVNNGQPISCPSTVPLELDWVDCDGNRVTSGFQGLATSIGDVNFVQDLGNGRNLYTWNIFGGSTTDPTTANFTYGDPNNLCTFSVEVPACEELDKRSALLNDPNRCGYGQNATGGTNLVEVSTEAEFFQAIQESNNYVCIMPALANTTIVRNSTFATNADNLTIDGSLAPGFKIKVGPSMPQNGYLFRFFGDNIIIHNIEGEGEGYPAIKNNNSFLNMYGNNIWIDKVTASRFDDDFVNLLLGTNNITVSRVKSFTTNKTVIYFAPNAGTGDATVTVHSSWMASTQRAPYMPSGYAHSFNNIVEIGQAWAGHTNASSASGTYNHNIDGFIISQHNSYKNSQFQSMVGNNTAQNSGYVESIDDWYNGSASFPTSGAGSTFGNVTFSSAPSLFNLPYDCSNLLKPVNQVDNYVKSVAGAA